MAAIDDPLGSVRVRSADFSLLQYLYKWVATVDHKRLGLMYIIPAILFLLVAGLMGSTHELNDSDLERSLGQRTTFAISKCILEFHL